MSEPTDLMESVGETIPALAWELAPTVLGEFFPEDKPIDFADGVGDSRPCLPVPETLRGEWDRVTSDEGSFSLVGDLAVVGLGILLVEEEGDVTFC